MERARENCAVLTWPAIAILRCEGGKYIFGAELIAVPEAFEPLQNEIFLHRQAQRDIAAALQMEDECD
jgi:hypothetical protein